MNLGICPKEKSNIIDETGQCVNSCTNLSEFTYKGKYFIYKDSFSYCLKKCPPGSVHNNTHCFRKFWF